MGVRLGINGFGRIGRCVLRASVGREDVEIVGVNDLADAEDLLYLLKYDSVHGRFEDASLEDEKILLGSREIPLFSEEDPGDLPWDSFGVDVALECTGSFREREGASKHLEAGSEKVLISAPPESPGIPQIVYGVNHDIYDGEEVVSNASCTTNSLAPMIKVLDESFGIESGLLTTVHSYTGSQNLIDGHSKKTRRGRAAAENIVPTTTGAARAVTEVIPGMEGRLDAMAMRVPTPNGSVSDLVVKLEGSTGADDVNSAFREASEGDMEGILGYTEEELVSRDIVGTEESVIMDGNSTMGLENGMIKVLGWYDNEYGFSCRMLDVARHIA